jgi:hypothetical protein
MNMDELKHPFGDTSPSAPMPRPPGPPPEPFGMLDLEELPETYGVDECCVIPREPTWLFAYWEVTGDGRAAARAVLQGDGRLILRIYSVAPGFPADTVDHALDWDHGRRYVPAPRQGAHVSAAVGLLAVDGRFAPIAHAPRMRVPWGEAGPEVPVEWMEVAPTRSRGQRLERPEVLRRTDVPQTRGLPPGAGAGRIGWPSSGLPSSGEMPSSPWRWRKDTDPDAGKDGSHG